MLSYLIVTGVTKIKSTNWMLSGILKLGYTG